MSRPIWSVVPLVVLLAGCGGWWGLDESGPRLPGEREPALLLEPELRPDPQIQNLPVTLPAPARNAAWPQNGGSATHAMHHLAAGDSLDEAWRVDIGTGADSGARQLSRPVVADGRVFAIDADGQISAISAEDGTILWSLTPEDVEIDRLGGGLAYENGWLFVTLSSGVVLGIDAEDGTEVWRQDLVVPIRAAPAVGGRRVLVLTADNQLYALDGTTGEPLWRHAGYFEVAGMLGGPTPAISGDIAVVPYSSGEVYAIRTDTGQPLWADTIQRPRVTLAMAAINDIDAHPVIDGDRVYVVGYGGEMVAIDLRRGNRIWEQEITSAETPWVAGDFVYVLTDRNEIAALLRENGRVRWVGPLPRFIDPEDPSVGTIVWAGPILVGDRLLLASSDGRAISVSPYTGEILGEIELPGPVHVAPLAADGTVYFLTDDGDLVAYR